MTPPRETVSAISASDSPVRGIIRAYLSEIASLDGLGMDLNDSCLFIFFRVISWIAFRRWTRGRSTKSREKVRTYKLTKPSPRNPTHHPPAKPPPATADD